MRKRIDSLKELREIPGVGKVIAQDLWSLGIYSQSDLKNQNPEFLYQKHNKLRGAIQDRCMLYVFRCAVYFVNTSEKKRDSKKLLWWYWKDK